MRFCNSIGIPHSAFLTWEPEDQSKALAYMVEDAVRCDMCGTADWEWQEDRFAYEPVEMICHGCEAKELLSQNKENRGAGRYIALEPRSD